MKKKKVNKVGQLEAQAEEVKSEKVEPKKVIPFAAWDNLMFMRRRQFMPQEGSLKRR
ncbi:hypothetical protein AWH56_015950 [Anaerobacillus isosaccharinicus]|uniref:Uncharacterized protein n=1 Tax=Anaerobacillus isosaccharinicus TaxID=1532552 RepID=A0A7S7R9X9_9BACI|nr:hypothetical protein [Anaerobacillus isosaccharinicus]MBA5587605.1 hypothetical protein [Anaerobacillus isosaccharinicus]QOY34218.1 hypothetical protein AWH56_015950 [Anaerobacillus isosaccharinicus]